MKMSMSIRRKELGAAGMCAALLAIFAVLSWSAVSRKSATPHDPLHALAAYVTRFNGVSGLSAKNPPRWKYWAMFPHQRGELKVDFDSSRWNSLPDDIWQGTSFVVQTLYGTPGNDPDTFINRSRAMMLVWGVVLGALIGVW